MCISYGVDDDVDTRCVISVLLQVAEWCESPSHLRAMPNFELPIEMSSSIGLHNVSFWKS